MDGWMDGKGEGASEGGGDDGLKRTGQDETNDSWVQAQMDWFLAVFAGTRGRV